MLHYDPVRIPDMPGRIRYEKKGETEYVRYHTGRIKVALRKVHSKKLHSNGRRKKEAQ